MWQILILTSIEKKTPSPHPRPSDILSFPLASVNFRWEEGNVSFPFSSQLILDKTKQGHSVQNQLSDLLKFWLMVTN